MKACDFCFDCVIERAAPAKRQVQTIAAKTVKFHLMGVFFSSPAETRMIRPNKTERPIAALADTNTRRDIDIKPRRLAPTADTQRTAVQTRPVTIARNRERLRQFARTVRKPAGRTIPGAPYATICSSPHKGSSARIRRIRHSLASRDYIQAFMHAVDEVNIGAPRAGRISPSCAE